jgi:hypothetical protein
MVIVGNGDEESEYSDNEEKGSEDDESDRSDGEARRNVITTRKKEVMVGQAVVKIRCARVRKATKKKTGLYVTNLLSPPKLYCPPEIVQNSIDDPKLDAKTS